MKSIKQSIKELIFSTKCSVCEVEVENNHICDNCLKRIEEKVGVENKGNFYWLLPYDKDVRRLIGSYKLGNQRDLGRVISGIIEKPLKKIIKDEKIDYIISVPISKKKKRTRGYNQVDEILKNLGLNYLSLTRNRNTKSMYEILDVEGRRKNVEGAISVDGEFLRKIKKKNILIIDDIVTTGATIEAILKEVKGQNKTIVVAIALAKSAREGVLFKV